MKPKYILAFAAHPDDIEFSCTGTLHKMMQNGYAAGFVILTDGRNGFKADGTTSVAERIHIRRQEELEVAKKLGLDEVLFLEYEDGFLQYTDALRGRLVEIIKNKKPQIIFSFDPANRRFDDLNLFHRDHRVASEAVFDAVFAAKNKWMYPGPAHQVEQIYFFGSDRPDHFEDISNLMDFKLDLLASHKSQFPDFSRVEKFVREDICGQHPHIKYSEPFRILDIKQIT